MRPPLSDAELVHLLATAKPREPWVRLLPGLPLGGAWPSLDWLEAAFEPMVDNLTARAVAAAVYEENASTPAHIRHHWGYGKRRYGTKNNHLADQAVGAGLMRWDDPRFTRGGDVTAEVAVVLRRLDAEVGRRMGFAVGDPEDDLLYASGRIVS